MKVKSWKEGEIGQPVFPNTYVVTKRWEGTCADIIKNSNKFYHAEVQVASNGTARIFTVYGRVGVTGSKEYRYYNSENSCLGDYESLIRKKRDRKKDPYREVDLAITSVGSEGAKEIKKPMSIELNPVKNTNSSLHTKVQNLVSNWFGTTGRYITMTLKCPLGQLSKEQIDKGRIVLDSCKDKINSKLKINDNEYDKLTSDFYSLIPHILPSKINASSLRLSSLEKIMEKHEMLDTFLDAKNVEGVIDSNNIVDDQYKKLNANLTWIDPNDPISKWINSMVQGTRASNHRFLGDIKILNIFGLSRNFERKQFLDRAADISKNRKTKDYIWPDQLKKMGEGRLDISEEKDIYKESNIIPLFHGTRTENMVGIITRGLLIRPSGAVYTGSAFGSGCYFGYSSKALNYSSCYGTYWAKGNDKSGFLFLADVCLGDPKYVYNSGFYTAENIRPYHSVWAKSGGYLINDEFILYHPTGKNQQHNLRYILEISTQN